MQIQFPKYRFILHPKSQRLNNKSRKFWLCAEVMALIALPAAIQGQEISDNFDVGLDAGWQHYTPTTAGGAIPRYTFPTYDSGRAYRMEGPWLSCQGVLQRGAAYRSEQYTEFFYSVDLVNFVPSYSAYALFGGRIGPPGNLAPLSTQGYMVAYLVGAPRQRQAALVNIEFTSEVISTIVDAWRGGAA